MRKGWGVLILLAAVACFGQDTVVHTFYASYQFNVLRHPTGITGDAANGLYIADSGNNVIRFFQNGSLTIFAGDGTAGYVVSTTLNSEFNSPTGLAWGGKQCWVNQSQNKSGCFVTLYVNDANNHLVRKICYGLLPPVGGACNGTPPMAGSGSAGFADGSATSATFGRLGGLVKDGSNFYIGDIDNSAIRKFDGTNVTTFTGTGTLGYANSAFRTSAQYAVPVKVAKDGSGNFFVADAGNNAVREISTSGAVTTYAGTTQAGRVDGTMSSSMFRSPTSLAFNSADNSFYVVDSGNHCIRRISGGQVTTYAGTGQPGYTNGNRLSAQFNQPTDILILGTAMYISDTMNNSIRRIDMSTGIVSTYIN